MEKKLIVIPLAGLSQRFFDEGFSVPKYMLRLNQKTLFYWAVKSFERYFADQRFLFICRDIYETKVFIEKSARELGILNFTVVDLKSKTLGQAHTVQLGLNAAGVSENEPIVIFNIDTFRPKYEMPDFIRNPLVFGYLECFEGSGSNWSNVVVEAEGSRRVIRTSEKQNESNLCCTGLYYFSTKSEFINCYHSYYFDKISNLTNEHYIAPIYNVLISQGKIIMVDIIAKSSVIFCGTPNEYYEADGMLLDAFE
ncbi:capsular biosynthesis protein [Roseobacter sp. HKCCD7870]|uniref:capsular biosynthesis protein n=1 Tax=Roseobacter sp. HKCCD7870 TaxID=3120343 RepID=UPI0030EEC70F